MDHRPPEHDPSNDALATNAGESLPSLTDLSGRTTGTYRILGRIGVGGMGEVYAAHDAKLDRPVALKVLSPSVSGDSDRLRRFHAEARAASSLNHPHILVIHDFGEMDGRPFIVTELVEGETLRRKLEHGPLPIAIAIDVMTQAASALSAAHARGIVHRDIKPENIMLRPDGYVKVLDFGLAKLMPSGAAGDVSQLQTQPGLVLGTPRYMSPEQARGLDTDPRTDVWSLGVVLYEILTGRPPFAGATNADLIAAILGNDPAPLEAVTADAPHQLGVIVAAALRKNPTERYATAADLHAALASLKNTVVPARAAATPTVRQHTVGRDRERQELHDAFRRAAAGNGHLLSISGDPGSGKTTLAEAFLDELTAAGMRGRIARGRCSERLAGSEAYLPVLEALESLLHSSNADTARQIADIAPTWYAQVATSTPAGTAHTSQSPASSQERLKREIAALVRELSRVEPLILFFDDVHWADASTIDLLAYLAPRFADLRVLIIVTSRPSDLQLSHHPFVSLRQDLQARRLCHEVTVDTLSLEDVERYLALEYPGHAFPRELPALIHAKTDGRPLFMADVVRYLRNNGTLSQDPDGRWRFAGSLDIVGRELPESVRGMIDRKIAQVSDDDRALLTAASVQGYEFDSTVIAQALGRDAGAVEERLEALESVHRFVRLVDEREFPDRTPTLRYRFAHVLYQNALYAQLRATRKVALSAAVAETLLRLYGSRARDVASELAPLLEAGRNYLCAADHYRLAAQHAASLLASREAEVLASRGLGLLDSVPDSPERKHAEIALRVSLGNALIATRGYSADEVLETWQRAHALCLEAGDSPLLPMVLYGFASSYLTRGDHPTSLSYAHELVALSKSKDDMPYVVGHRLVGWPLLAMGRLDEAREHFTAVVDGYLPDRHRALAYVAGHEPGMGGHINLAMTLSQLGDHERARHHRTAGIDIALQTPHANTHCYAYHFGSIHDQLAGDRRAARDHSEAALRIAEEQGLKLWLGWSAMIHGWSIAIGPDVDSGVAEMRRGLAAARAAGASLFNTYYLGLLAEALVAAGRLDEAEATLNEAETLAARNHERFGEALLRRIRREIGEQRQH